MKVLCIAKKPPSHNNRDLWDAYYKICIGNIYTVINTLCDCYQLEEFPGDIFWEAEYFAPLSDVDEAEMVRDHVNVNVIQ